MEYLVIAALAWLVYYVLACLINPFRTCRWCNGSGKRRPRVTFGMCWWCGGDGCKLRWGRRFLNYVLPGIRND